MKVKSGKVDAEEHERKRKGDSIMLLGAAVQNFLKCDETGIYIFILPKVYAEKWPRTNVRKRV